jgi:hypothetical protein
MWTGQFCQKLLLDCRGGLGDLAFYSRFLPELQACGIRPFLFVREEQVPLVRFLAQQSWSGIQADETAEGCEFWIWADLFSEFEITPENIARRLPLPIWEIDPDLVEASNLEFRSRATGRPVIGLCARASDEKHGFEGLSTRSLTVEQTLKLVSSTPQCQWVNLHPEPLDLPNVLNLPAGSIEMLAARISACDAIVSVDTFVAHLGGSMGKTTSLLLSPHWHWFWSSSLEDDRRSIFYPSVSLFGKGRPRKAIGSWLRP